MRTDDSPQLRHVFSVTSGATPASGNPDYWGGEILWVTPEDLSGRKSYWLENTRRKITLDGYESSGATMAPASSIVLSKRAPIGQLAVLKRPACSNQGCFLLTPRSYSDTRFYYYWLSCKVRLLQALGRGSTFMEISADDLRSIRIPTPSPDTQRAVADYLDSETAQLDALVAEKERLLNLLVEKKRALITHAVTRGLDPHAPLRDSGIPWLGKIPAHWEVKRLKYIGRAILGLTFDTSDIVNNDYGVLVLRASNVQDQKIVLEDNLYVLMDVPDILRTRVGDILICSRSGSRALIGKNALIDQASAGMTFGAFMTVFRSPYNEYLFYIFNSTLFDYQAGAFSTTTINQLTVEILNSMEVPLPPLSEQKAIVANLLEKTSRLDPLIDAMNRTIDLLKERRVALITAAVTKRTDGSTT